MTFILFTPFIVLIFVQITKLIIESWRGKFSWNHMFSNGGMPSSHSAFMTSVCTMIYIVNGFDSTFVLALAITLIVIWDAVKTRGQIGYHGVILNKLIKELPDTEEYKYPIIKERVGHKPSEVIVGLIIGVLLTYLISLF